MGKRETKAGKNGRVRVRAKEKEKHKEKSRPAGKATGTTTTTTTTTTTKSNTTAPPVDLAEVRRNISNIVGSSAAAMASAVVEAGKTGQLAPVKYLFEVSGLYPASESSGSGADQEVLARTLMRGLNLPETLVVSEDGEEAGLSMHDAAAKVDAGQAKAEVADSGTGSARKDSREESGAERAETIP
jgi:hypothetical protein